MEDLHLRMWRRPDAYSFIYATTVPDELPGPANPPLRSGDPVDLRVMMKALKLAGQLGRGWFCRWMCGTGVGVAVARALGVVKVCI